MDVCLQEHCIVCQESGRLRKEGGLGWVGMPREGDTGTETLEEGRE